MKRTLLILSVLPLIASFVSAESHQNAAVNNIATVNHAFKPGEKLTYSISWSNILSAGEAVMEVRTENRPDGRRAYRIISTAGSRGLVSAFYSVADVVQSVVDAEGLYSLYFNLNQKHGKRIKKREMVFDHEKKIVRIISDGVSETREIPFHAHDSLSSLYYLRTREDFLPGQPIVIDVHDSGKNWAVEVQTLGREKLKTSLGEFNTIKVKTYPKYEGVFLHKGEIFIWLTDDEKKVPVLMKSKIAIGSIVATLTEMKGGEEPK